MALTSPGVQVSVIDESFYTPAEPGTTPMIFVVSKQDKQNGAGTGTAAGTTKAKAGTPYLITSQRDLTETFGDPIFKTDTSNNPIHAGELNEYGLQAAYSYLGVSNRAYVTRADIDLAEIEASASAPAADPANGTYWFDTAQTKYGIFEWNGNAATVTGGQSFTNKVPVVITSNTNLVGESNTGIPKGSVGQIGDYAVVTTTTVNKIYYKNASGAWKKVGAADWVNSHPTIVASTANPTLVSAQTIVINGTTVSISGTTVSAMETAIDAAGITGVSSAVIDGKLNIYSDGTSTTDGSTDDDGAIAISAGASGTLLADLGITAGTYYAPALEIKPHTSVPEWKTAEPKSRPSGSVWLKTTEANLGANYSVKKYNSTTKLWSTESAPLYTSHAQALYNMDKAGGGMNLTLGQVYIQAHTTLNEDEEADFTLFARNTAGATTITSSAVTASSIGAGAKTFTMAESIVGQAAMNAHMTVSFTAAGATADADTIADAINAKGFTNIVATVDASNRVVISHNDGGEIRIKDTSGALANIGFSAYNYTTKLGTANLYTKPSGDSLSDWHASNWKILTYTASGNAPTALTSDGRLWYSSIVDEVDMMVHNGTTWKGYGGVYPSADPNGPIVSATEPTEQSDTTPLVTGDLWISTADLETYPQVHRYNADLTKWIALDESDQTTEDGILFADARYGTSGGTATTAPSGTIKELLVSDHLDTDAPDPALYPKGMLLWNLRRSGFNVKKFVRNHVVTTDKNVRMDDASQATYYPHRWVTESANQIDGSGSFGRKAQRKVVVQALQALVNSNQDIRDDESRLFNLMACPGYSELIGEMQALNNDRGLTAFIVGDSPFRLTSDATTLNNWGSNVNLAVEDNDNGLVTRDEYLGVFYPSLFTSDNAGKNVTVPASHGMLRTLALSDQVSFPWFAPAGTRRGGITNASAAGYIDGEGEFKSVALNEGQRDTLYSQSINPITFLTGAGLVNYGQKTRAKNASALDRINVARLVVYLRSQLKKLAKPYIFEPNDKITRDEIKAQADSLMLELVSQRALYDFLCVCDESNNTPARIDRNELYLDIAIEPVKAVEFIYIPLRLKNTGEIAGL
ncbi:MAG: hypothetical protein CMA64_11630 [Euryarchaeota archaeon]|nr:hypothetical protein [Euryarchaeota archaeon]